MSKIHFEKLTPNKDIDLNTYEEALNFMFEDDEDDEEAYEWYEDNDR